MALTGKTIGQLTYLSGATSDTLFPVELSGDTYHVPFSGITGNSGTSGTSGSSGTSGTDGTSGTSGTDGTSGTSGTDGTSGTSGTSGSSGTDGTSGTSGTDGTSGTSGTDGTSGTSGTDGTSGSSGTSGTSGSSGTSALLSLTGTTTNGIITYNGSGSNATVQSGVSIENGYLTLSGGTTLRDNSNSSVALGLQAGGTGTTTTQGGFGVAIGPASGAINQGFGATSVGYVSGSDSQGDYATSVGYGAGQLNQTQRSVAVGLFAGSIGQGFNSVAIGPYAGYSGQPANSIMINASDTALTALTTNALYVAPIRTPGYPTFDNCLYYDTITKEVQYGISRIPSWNNAGTIQLNGWGATTTAPTIVNTVRNRMDYRRVGLSEYEVRMVFEYSSGGSAGSGDYLFTLPVGSFIISQFQTAYQGDVGGNSWNLAKFALPASGTITNGSVGGQVYPIIWDSTRFRILTTTYGTGIQCWSSGFYGLGGVIEMTFSYNG